MIAWEAVSWPSAKSGRRVDGYVIWDGQRISIYPDTAGMRAWASEPFSVLKENKRVSPEDGEDFVRGLKTQFGGKLITSWDEMEDVPTPEIAEK